MKVEVSRADLIVLSPETDADSALLKMWADGQAHIASSGGVVGEPMKFSVAIRFTVRKTDS